MKIERIIIENIKGIQNHTFDFILEPNKPIFFVAPNGFGKTSFGIAFDSLIASKIDLNKKNWHKNKITNLPKIQIDYIKGGNSNSLEADNSKNDINSEFDIFVINSKLVAKAKIANIQGNRIAKSSLEIQKTVLINTIPQKVLFDYIPRNEKAKFNPNQKIATNITDVFQNSALMNEINQNIDFSKLQQVKKSEILSGLFNELLSLTGTVNEIKNHIISSILPNIALDEINKICSILKRFDLISIKNDADLYIASFQIISVQNRLGLNFKKAVKYLEFLNEKNEYQEIISSINSTRYNIKPEKDGRKLVINWPKAHNISNGQRDVLTFITLLHKARKSFKKDNCILIIDEIFDYLDDGNLISFQYYISEFIERMSKDKFLFPIILTHLDPKFFNHFCFNDKKIQVKYLKTIETKTSLELLKIIYKRDETDLKSDLDKFYFHYHTDNSSDLTTVFEKHHLNTDWANSISFLKRAFRELRRYLFENTTYDPIAVCIALRVHIEKLAYETLTDNDNKKEFLNVVKNTRNKLNFCIDKGKNIPEVFYLLGIIYNSSLHLSNGQDITVPLSLKLENITIKKMIRSVCIQ